MPTADKKNFIVEKGVELEGGFTLNNVSVTNLIDSAGATTILTDSTNAATIINSVGNYVKGYDSSDLLPLSNNTTGELNYVKETNRLYLWNGSGWYNIAIVNNTPTMTTTPDSSYTMDSVGASLTITLVATDSEGLPITYSATSDSSSTFVTITQDSGVFTITPLTQAQLDSNGVSEGGTFSINFKASDGVNIVPNVTNFTLTITAQPVTNSKYTSALVTATGTSDNSDISDASSNNISLTKPDDLRNSSFSPYRHGGYSWYGSASGAYSTATVGTIGTNEFTIECWVYWPTVSGPEGVFEINTSLAPSSQTNTISVFTRSSTYSYNWAFATNGTQVNSSTAPTANTWHHVALVRNSSNLITLYIDGTSLITRTDSTNISATTLAIGRYYNTTFNVNGYIHDFRIVNGTAVYTSNFTPPTEKLTAVTNTDLLAYRNGTFMDESTNSRFIFQGIGVEAQPFTPYDNVPYEVADHGGSIYFDGGAEYITPASLGNSSVTDFTISFWMYPESLAINTSLYPRVLTIGGPGDDSDNFIVYVDTSYQIKLYTGSAVRIESGSGSSGVLRPNNWHHVVIKRNSGTWRMIVNGVSQGTYTQSAGIDFTSGMNIGKNTTAAGYYTGNISDFKIEFSSTSSSTATVPTSPYSSTGTELHLKGTDASVVDKAQKNNTILNGNTTGSTTQAKFSAKSMYFDGTDDYVSMSNFESLPGDFTIEAWIYMTSVSAEGIVCRGRNSAGGHLWYVENSRLKFRAYNGSGSNQGDIQAATALSANTWNHVAITRSGSTLRFFINGTLDATTGTLSPTNGPMNSTDDMEIGGYTYNGSHLLPFSGYMQDVRITKGLARYTASFTVPSASLEG